MTVMARFQRLGGRDPKGVSRHIASFADHNITAVVEGKAAAGGAARRSCSPLPLRGGAITVRSVTANLLRATPRRVFGKENLDRRCVDLRLYTGRKIDLRRMPPLLCCPKGRIEVGDCLAAPVKLSIDTNGLAGGP